MHLLPSVTSIMSIDFDLVLTICQITKNMKIDRTNFARTRLETSEMSERLTLYGPRQANLVLIAYASSEGSGEPAHPRSLARTFAARSYKQ